MTGRELAETLAAERPQMKILLMSGYGDHAQLHGPGSIPDVAFIQKPFDLATLSTKVRAVLGV